MNTLREKLLFALSFELNLFVVVYFEHDRVF